jgi:hypothetical protein
LIADINETRERCYDFEIFLAKNWAKKLALSFKLLLAFAKRFEEKRNFFAENRQKSKKIAIITLTPS